jgi:hypothetical protein
MIKLAVLLFTALKFGKIAATGGTMALSLILYAQIFGWAYAAGFLACCSRTKWVTGSRRGRGA